LLRAGAISAAVLAQQTGQEFDFDPDAPDVAAWIKQRLSDTVSGMVDGTVAMLRETAEWLVGAAAAGIAVAVGAHLLREQVGLNEQQGAALSEVTSWIEVQAAGEREIRAADTAAVESMQAANEGRGQS